MYVTSTLKTGAAAVALALVAVLALVAPASAKPARDISINYDQIGTSSSLFLKGDVKPDYHNKAVIIQEKRNGNWVKLKTGKTDGSGHYKIKIRLPHDGQVHKYRATSKKTNDYRASHSKVVALHYV